MRFNRVMASSSDLELWQSSADAWIQFVQNDVNRTRVLDPVVLELCGSMWGKKVLDVGCGEGRFSRKLATRGADVIGVDPVDAFLAEARKLDPLGDYLRGSAERLDFRADQFDAVVFYLSLCDIADLNVAFEQVTPILRDGGHLIIADLHPMIGQGEWQDEGFLVREYMQPCSTIAEWRNIRVRNYFRPISAWAQTLTKHGLVMEQFCEPTPTAEMIEEKPSQEKYTRVPMFIAMRWRLEKTH